MSIGTFRWLAWACLYLAVVVIAVAAVLSFGVVERQLTVSGPFKADSAATHSLIVDLRQALPLRKVFSSGGDSLNNPYASNLQVQVNGVSLNAPHSLHDLIRSEGGGAFSHWGDHLIFSLPHGIGNSAATQLEIRFALRLHPRLVENAFFFCLIGSAMLLWQFRRQNPLAYGERVSSTLVMLGGALRGMLALCLLMSIVFLGSVFAGWWTGFVLPNVAFFHWWPQLNGLALHEPFFGHALLAIAMVGAGAAWLASTSSQRGGGFASIEAGLVTGFCRYGVVFVVALFLYSVGAAWAGIPRPQDLGGNAIAGLLPFNDANGHFQHVYFQAMQGSWDPFVARRPLAAAFRTVVVAGVDYNNFHFLMLQSVALAVATFFAARAVVNWRGIWAGLTFVGLVHIMARPYLSTNLTEPLGIFWALVSVPFLIRAIRNNRLSDAIAGFHLTLWALMIRMGGMFTLPAIGLWVILSQWGARWKVVRATLLIILLVVANTALISGLSRLYGTAGGATGSNFSHTICGLTHGTDWTGCGRVYAEQLQELTTEAEQASFYYARAKEKFLSDPGVLFNRLLKGEGAFFEQIWKRMLTGYTGTIPDIFPAFLWWMSAIAGMTWVMRSRREKHEGSFWLLFIASLAVSAPFVIFDDGWRVLSASFPLLAVLIASGFASPLANSVAALQVADSSTNKRHYFALASVVALCIMIPTVVHQGDWLGRQQIPDLDLAQDEDIFLGTRRMSGFLVMPDGADLPRNVPAIHHSSFVKIVRNSGIEQYEALVTPSPIHQPPFAIVSAIPVNRKTHGLLVLPPEVFSMLDDRLWLFRFGTGKYWLKVTEARPLVQ